MSHTEATVCQKFQDSSVSTEIEEVHESTAEHGTGYTY